MRRPAFLLTSMALLCASATTQTDTPRAVQTGERAASRALTPQAEIQALLAGYDASKKDYPVKFAEFRPRFEAFAEKHRGSDAGLEAELWLFSGCWWSRKDGTMNEKAAVVADRILEHYKDSKKLGKMLDLAYVFSDEQKQAYCSRIEKISTQPEVKAAVYLTLGKLWKRSKNHQQRQLSKSYFMLVGKEFKDVPYRSTTYGAIAEAYLYIHDPKDLEVGKIAPRITGHGVDGKAMKLSDFRGKIVVLDFWGDW